MQPFDNAPRYSFVEQPQPATPGASFTLFNNLDENNEIGSCSLYAHYKAEGKSNTVVYQAKTNLRPRPKRNFRNSPPLYLALAKKA